MRRTRPDERQAPSAGEPAARIEHPVAPTSTEAVLQLQRQVGNAAVRRIMRSGELASPFQALGFVGYAFQRARLLSQIQEIAAQEVSRRRKRRRIADMVGGLSAENRHRLANDPEFAQRLAAMVSRTLFAEVQSDIASAQENPVPEEPAAGEDAEDQDGPAVEELYSVQFGKEPPQVANRARALQLLHNRYLSACSDINAAVRSYLDQDELEADQPLVAASSAPVMLMATLPEPMNIKSLWRVPNAELRLAKDLIEQGDPVAAGRQLRLAYAAVRRSEEWVARYIGGSIKTAGEVKDFLEVVKVASAVTVGVLAVPGAVAAAGVAGAGAAGAGALGAGATASGIVAGAAGTGLATAGIEYAQEASEVWHEPDQTPDLARPLAAGAQAAGEDLAFGTAGALAAEGLGALWRLLGKRGVKAVARPAEETADLVARALNDGGQEAADEACATIARALARGMAPEKVVGLAGGSWAKVAKAVARSRSDDAVAVARTLTDWREAELLDVVRRVDQRRDELGAVLGRPLGQPQFARTGTSALTSDVDISFLGADSGAFRQAAVQELEQRFGTSYEKVRKLLDLDVFTDPNRLLMYKRLEGKSAGAIEQAMVDESELNMLAKMLRDPDIGPGRVREHAAKLDIEWDSVNRRAAELAPLTDPAKRARAERELDDLHRGFDGERDPRRRAALAEEMAVKASRLNAATEGAYGTPGGVAANVSLRDNVGNAREWLRMTPELQYMAMLDDLAMLEPVLGRIRKGGFTPEDAKNMVKYADRQISRASALGAVDLFKAGRARELFDAVDGLLAGMRGNPIEVARKAAGFFDEAMTLLEAQLSELIPRARQLGRGSRLEEVLEMQRTGLERTQAGSIQEAIERYIAGTAAKPR